MGAGANSSGNKSLNDKAERAAGRQGDRGRRRRPSSTLAASSPARARDRRAARTARKAGPTASKATRSARAAAAGVGSRAATSPNVNASTKPAKKR